MEAENKNTLCYCNDVKYQDIENIIKKKPGIKFDELQKITNAGTSCTACILNLEDEFIKKTSSLPKKNKNFVINKFLKKNFKQIIYKIIDYFSPSLPIVINNYFPILNSKNLEIFIWLANYSNLYKNSDSEGLVDHNIIMLLYNSEGNLLWKKKFFLKRNSDLNIKIPTDLLKNEYRKKIEYGWLHIKKFGKKSGLRGTTRPQIQYLTSNASCAVHGQDIKLNNGGSYALVYNPNSDRQFLNFLNLGSKNLSINLTLLKKDGSIKDFNKINLKSLNSVFYELELDKMDIKEFEPIIISWQCVGVYKCHVIITDKLLTRFSLDHH
jgi:bacterioferritin-associated ferredoxin